MFWQKQLNLAFSFMLDLHVWKLAVEGYFFSNHVALAVGIGPIEVHVRTK